MPLANFYAACGPWVHPDTIAAVAAVESGSRPWTIGTPHGAYYATSEREAATYLARAMRTEPSVDIGLMQINSQWIARLNIAPEALLDPCTNVRVGAAILAADFVAAVHPGRTRLQTLVAALSMYHSGTPNAAIGYAIKVLKAAFQSPNPMINPTKKSGAR
ncbi:MAG TPA: transglycosylase SLT domain-containing protein [Rudaea sp.]|jgi:type IV secretion system protein VirB1|nr:transglycosylase SLT domain-containing protein [Rudaea sp.]